MQANSFLSDLIHFKDEIFKKIRLLDNRLTKDINDKYIQSNLIFETINNRLNLISSNNDSLLELLTSQKLNLDKIEELGKSNERIERSIQSNELKVKQISSEMENLRSKYDIIIQDHLQVGGYIGPGCHYKKMSDYIRENITEFSKLKNDKEKLKYETANLKNKVEDMIKNTSNNVNKAIILCQKYSDHKSEDMREQLQNKTKELNEKISDLKDLINKVEENNEKDIGDLKLDIEKLQSSKEELINDTNNKINEINNRIDSINKEIKGLKSMRKDFKNKRRSMISFNSNMFNRFSYNNNNENRNSINISGEEERIHNFISRKKSRERPSYFNKDEAKETKEIKEKKINNNNDIKDLSSSLKDEEINIKNKMEEEKDKTISEECTLRSFEKIFPKITMEKKEEIKKIKIDAKNEENLIIKKKNLFSEKTKEKKLNEINNKEKTDKIPINNNNDNKEEKPKNINDNINIDIKKNIIEKEKIKILINSPKFAKGKEQNKIIQKNKTTIPTKIRIESQEKLEKKEIQKSSLSNDSRLVFTNIMNQNINQNKIQSKKKEIKDPDLIKTISHEQYNSNENTLSPIYQKFQNIDLINKMKYRNRTMLSPSPTKSISYYMKLEKTTQKKPVYKMNEEQKQVMDNIKSHFDIVKERQEKNYAENTVSCNVINLHLEKNKKGEKNESTKIFKNNVSEIGMKLSPAFGRTAYNFFIKNKMGESFENNKIRLNKVNSLKDGLNAALITTIKNQIYFNDK